ncbi:hypothetical protein [Clostridium thailandense]
MSLSIENSVVTLSGNTMNLIWMLITAKFKKWIKEGKKIVI